MGRNYCYVSCNVLSPARGIFSFCIFPFSISRFTFSHLNLFIAVTKLSAKLHARKFGAMKRAKKRSRRGREVLKGGVKMTAVAQAVQHWQHCWQHLQQWQTSIKTDFYNSQFTAYRSTHTHAAELNSNGTVQLEVFVQML